ncbi:hypothetical protein WM06_15820 [Burkholderia cepacia]|nr:hypothetical protein WM06_15820 [Burkholderia cepacia]
MHIVRSGRPGVSNVNIIVGAFRFAIEQIGADANFRIYCWIVEPIVVMWIKVTPNSEVSKCLPELAINNCEAIVALEIAIEQYSTARHDAPSGFALARELI